MKYEVLKGCVLEGNKQTVGEVISLTDDYDIRVGLSYNQIKEHQQLTKNSKKTVKKMTDK